MLGVRILIKVKINHFIIYHITYDYLLHDYRGMAKWFGAHYNSEVRFSSAVGTDNGFHYPIAEFYNKSDSENNSYQWMSPLSFLLVRVWGPLTLNY